MRKCCGGTSRPVQTWKFPPSRQEKQRNQLTWKLMPFGINSLLRLICRSRRIPPFLPEGRHPATRHRDGEHQDFAVVAIDQLTTPLFSPGPRRCSVERSYDASGHLFGSDRDKRPQNPTTSMRTEIRRQFGPAHLCSEKCPAVSHYDTVGTTGGCLHGPGPSDYDGSEHAPAKNVVL